MKTIKSVIKALSILELFKLDKREMTLGEIASALKIDKTTVNRLAVTLVQQGYLYQRKKWDKYSLGMKLIDVAGVKLNEFNIRNTDIPYIIVELSRLVNESVYFSVWYGSDILLSRSLINSGSLNDIPSEWDNAALHQTCVGKIILANMSNEDLVRYVRRRSFLNNTSDTVPDIDSIKKQLLAVKRGNLAFEDEEHQPGVSGVAAGVKNKEGETIGAIFIMGPSVRLTHAVLIKVAPSIQRSALKVSEELGYKA